VLFGVGERDGIVAVSEWLTERGIGWKWNEVRGQAAEHRAQQGALVVVQRLEQVVLDVAQASLQLLPASRTRLQTR
jgi:hypothetical protein